MKPFVKWVGGKRQLLQEIEVRLPEKFNTYYEPFLGGGAVLFHLQPKKAVVGDSNKDLIYAYKCIQNQKEELLKSLSIYEEEHAQSPEDYYYRVRSQDRAETYKDFSPLERASRFLYLNKSGFNGLYRVNSKNQNNVPWNKKDKVILSDIGNFEEISHFLNQNDISINQGDFESIVSKAKKGDFIYFDPPYDTINNSTFDSYAEGGFGKEGQKRLADIFMELHLKGCYILLSNHDTQYIRELYNCKNFNIDIVKASRKINSNPNKRGLMNEVLIYNYDIKGENMKKIEFESILNNLKETISTPKYFSDFNKAICNVDLIEDGLNLMDGLIGKENPEEKLLELVEKYGDTITRIIPILHAIRIYKTQSDNSLKFLDTETKLLEEIYFTSKQVDNQKIINFCKNTGLLDIYKNKNIINTKSYVMGVEIGLDSNARKNRGGLLMEQIVENILRSDKKIQNISTQISTKNIIEQYGIDLDSIETKALKKYDFAFEYNNTLYLVETNFYGSSGSKLNETARSYKQLQVEIDKTPNCEFIWITDGIGWRKARGNLQETYTHNKYVFTLEMFKNHEISELLERP